MHEWAETTYNIRYIWHTTKEGKGKDIPVTGHGGP
jgi:hypothetical protein